MSQQQRTSTAVAERAILFQLLRGGRDERWELGELEAVLSDLPRVAVGVAIECLSRYEAIVRADGVVVASSCARHLDCLGMVAI